MSTTNKFFLFDVYKKSLPEDANCLSLVLILMGAVLWLLALEGHLWLSAAVFVPGLLRYRCRAGGSVLTTQEASRRYSVGSERIFEAGVLPCRPHISLHV